MWRLKRLALRWPRAGEIQLAAARRSAGFGLLAVSNKRRNISIGSWMETGGGRVAYRSSLRGDGRRLTRSPTIICVRTLCQATVAVESDVHHVELGRARKELG
ncbi:MAG: hypothetical protein WKF84_21370 [Pyrinomonadaceae bacterium]